MKSFLICTRTQAASARGLGPAGLGGTLCQPTTNARKYCPNGARGGPNRLELGGARGAWPRWYDRDSRKVGRRGRRPKSESGRRRYARASPTAGPTDS